MKKIKKILFIFITGIIISVIGHSCFPTDHFVMKNVRFWGLTKTNANELQETTVISQLLFRIIGTSEWEYAAQTSIYSINFINTCYATSRPAQYDKININTIKLIVNKDIYFENDTIKANTDLWNNSLLKDFIWFDKNKRQGMIDTLDFGFVENVYQKLQIPNGEYNFEVSFETSENQSFKTNVELEYQH
jgi:hypothetical protein